MKKRYTYPVECKHKSFFDCSSAKQCLGCYYNPIKEIALGPYHDGEESEGLWFYDDKEWAEKALIALENIRTGKGRLPGGLRIKFKYSRDDSDGQEIE